MDRWIVTRQLRSPSRRSSGRKRGESVEICRLLLRVAAKPPANLVVNDLETGVCMRSRASRFFGFAGAFAGLNGDWRDFHRPDQAGWCTGESA
jgi:hypothetical protein